MLETQQYTCKTSRNSSFFLSKRNRWACAKNHPMRERSLKSTVILYVCWKSRVDTCAIIGKQVTSWDSNPVNSTSSNKHRFEMLDRSKKLGNNLASKFRRRIKAKLQGRIVSWENVSYRVRTDFFQTFFQNNNFFSQKQGYRIGHQQEESFFHDALKRTRPKLNKIWQKQ